MNNIYYVECSFLGDIEERWFGSVTPDSIRETLTEMGRKDIKIFQPVPDEKGMLRYSLMIPVE